MSSDLGLAELWDVCLDKIASKNGVKCKSTMVAGVVMWPQWGPTPGNKAYNNQLLKYSMGLNR